MAAFVPTLQPGSLTYTLLCYIHRSEGRILRTQTYKDFGHDIRRGANPFASGYGEFLPILFGEQAHPLDVLCAHTMFGYFSLAHSVRVRDRWLSDLAIRGTQQTSRPYTFSEKTVHRLGLRWCPACAKEELRDKGTSSWYAWHQLPFVQACPLHAQPLVYRCNDCARALDCGRSLRLPGDACQYCGGQSFTGDRCEITPTYLKLIRHTRDDVLRQPDFYRPEVWANQMKQLTGSAGSREELEAEVVTRLNRSWGVTRPSLLAKVFGIHLEADFVRYAIRGSMGSMPLLAQQLIAEVLPRLRKESLSEPCQQSANHQEPLGEMEKTILTAASDFRVPPEYFRVLVSTGSSIAAATAAYVKRSYSYITIMKSPYLPAQIRRSVEQKIRRNLSGRKVPIGSLRIPFEADRLEFLEWMNGKKDPIRNDLFHEKRNLFGRLRNRDREWFNQIFPAEATRAKRRLANCKAHLDRLLSGPRLSIKMFHDQFGSERLKFVAKNDLAWLKTRRQALEERWGVPSFNTAGRRKGVISILGLLPFGPNR